jgi:hypothetical protein
LSGSEGQNTGQRADNINDKTSIGHIFTLISHGELESEGRFSVSSDGTHIVTSEHMFVSGSGCSFSTHVPTVTGSETVEHN